MTNDDAVILVVDDDDDVREAVSSALDDEGYRVLVARDGIEALELVREARPHLIVLDLTMPRMNGAEFKRRLDAESPDVSAPLVVMSADVEGRAKARSIGAAAFLQKPVRLRELFRVVDANLRSAEEEVEPLA